ncbi:hypothetical protein [Allomesorhizobium camelthorni]|uniref:Uncharacterized protein n=1 Tax=Allomesorhizobium camelthorni TaxID=475069 RepID=A0A6G4WJA8_9HYPH|nr:hypothetical protein [Mesorhizobium camelthorni]NGO54167.1 hypothetical protein [Mesorhizobium camelthorni]
MIAVERIARDLAAVLSPGGEADWRQYLALARTVEKSLNRQFDEVFHLPPESGSGQRLAGGRAQRSGRVVSQGKN